MIGTAQRPASRFPVEAVVAAAAAVATIPVLAALYLGQIVYLVAAAIAIAIFVTAFRHPGWAAVAFAVMVPLNRFLLLGLAVVTHSPGLQTIAVLWKELLLAAMLARVAYDAAFSPAPKRLLYLDLLVAGFIAAAALYVIWPGVFNQDLFSRIQGFRTDASFLFAYFAGRAIQVSRPDVRRLLLALVPGALLVSALAAFEFTHPAVANAISNLLGTQGLEVVRQRGIAGVDLPRASGLMGDLALAFYEMVMLAIFGSIFALSRGFRNIVLRGALVAVSAITLALTLSRSGALAGAVVLGLAAVIAGAWQRLAVLAAVLALLLLGALAFTGTSTDTLTTLLSAEDASATGHADALGRSLLLVQSNPLGQGLGTAGTIGQRYLGAQAITNENWYLQVASEMGVLMAGFFLLLVVAMVLSAGRSYLRAGDFWLRCLCLGVMVAGVGFLVLGNLLHAWEDTVLSMFVWLAAGIAVRAPELERSREWRG